MITILLMGGTGNQLFQYAVGRHLAILHKTSLVLDTSYYETDHTHSYSLDNFNIQAITKCSTEYSNFFHERHFHFDSQVLSLPDKTCLEGYFQSEKYFKEIEKILREEFYFKDFPKDSDSAFIAEQIKAKTAVSVHIRRGNYVNHPLHEVCTLDYYKKAITYMLSQIQSVHFFFFSDDLPWVCEQFKELPYDKTFVALDYSSQNPVNDMWLMSLCKHYIIANSTFSWWAAYLSQYTGKLILAPNKWFNDPTKELQDLFPNNFIPISFSLHDTYKPKRNKDWQLHWLDDQPMLFSKSHDGVHLLNPVAGFIWTCCDGKTDVKSIRKALQDVFVENKNYIIKDLPNTLELWQEMGLIAR